MDPPQYSENLRCEPANEFHTFSQSSVEQSRLQQPGECSDADWMPIAFDGNISNAIEPEQSKQSSGFTNPGYELLPEQQEQEQNQQEESSDDVPLDTGYPSDIVVQPECNDSYLPHQALACLVTFCCMVIPGLLAYNLAYCAEKRKHTNPQAARRLGRASLGVSVAGMILGVIILVFVLMSNTKSRSPGS